ncbi:MAG: Gfo/Idh/MocA family oxidoreductase [Alphaproteobacteria bacterium]|nr:Gfo/Idh/MocA family oxidoreductase [Alphaproteobacteria bacterium]
MEPVRFGVISTARIGLERVIPAMLKGEGVSIKAIASRDLDRAKDAAGAFGIEKAYGSYEELLADPEIEAVYNPLPNHLHVPVSIQAAKAGKHVLCEKPIALDADEARTLIEARDRTGVVIAEAFMVRHHPQWQKVRELVKSGRIGRLRAVQAVFSYMNRDPDNVRNQVDIGGGGIYDIGCYPVVTARFLFDDEPVRAAALIERDPDFQTDRLASAILHFPEGQAQFICSTQLVAEQRMQILGTEGRIELDIPFTPLEHETSRLLITDGSQRGLEAAEVITFEGVNQYTLQGDHFAAVVRGEAELAFALEDAVKNMAVIDALYRSGDSGGWEGIRS